MEENKSPSSVSMRASTPSTGAKRTCSVKVEKILKGSLNLIPSPSISLKIQIMDGKVCLRCKGKTLLDVDITKQCFALLPQVNFPGDGIKSRLSS